MSKKNTEDEKVYIITKGDAEEFDIIAATLDENAAQHYCDVHNIDPSYKDFWYEEYDLDDFDHNEEQRHWYTCVVLVATGEIIGEEEKIIIVNKNTDPLLREIYIATGPFSVARDYKPSDLAVFAKSFMSAEKAREIASDYRDLIINQLQGIGIEAARGLSRKI